MIRRRDIGDPSDIVTVADMLAVLDDSTLDGELRNHLVDHPAISDRQLNAFLRVTSDARRLRILCATARQRVLLHWLRHGQSDVRCVVAFNPSLPGDVARRLLRDPDPCVRANALFHPGVSDADVAHHEHHDDDPRVRDTAAWLRESEVGRAMRRGESCFEVVDSDDPPVQ